MKATIISTVAALAAVAAAIPTEGYHVAQVRDVDVASSVDMIFTGPIRPGGPNVTLTGTAQSIYEQLLEENPEYNPWEFPEYKERMNALGLTDENADNLQRRDLESYSSTLSKRGGFTCNPAGSEVGNYITQCAEGTGYLRGLNGYCRAPAGPSGCARVSCSHNCGIFLCNDNNFEISVWCGNLAGDVFDIASECGYSYNDWIVSLKGQVFRDGPPAWNTIVKSQSC